MTILCEPNCSAAAALVPAIEGVVRTVANLPDVAMTMNADPGENVVIIGSEVPLDEVLSFSGQMATERPDVAIILLRGALDPSTVAAAASVGVSEVVPVGDAQHLLNALQRARSVDMPELEELASASEPGPGGKIVTVFSAKGGTGKTTVATNLAIVLNADGARRVCLVDLDLAFGDVAISLQIAPARTLIDAVEAVGLTDDDLVDLLTTQFRPGLDCVLAPVGPGDAEKVPPWLVGELLVLLRRRYEFVVIDTPSQFSEHVLEALDASDHHILLTTPEIPALKNLRLTLDMLDLLAYPHDRRAIILNRSDGDGGLSASDVETAIMNPITMHVPSSRDIPCSINRGVPLAASHPDHSISKAIQQLATSRLIDEPVAATRRFGRRGPKLRKRSA
ncbi:MAG: MinD/ParA family protein [Pseudonocardiales bacterium]|nr:MAG: MinD/ParA family protein [Pseudonocardiales bacterium]